MGNEKYNGVAYGHEATVERLITLGTPHLSVEKYPFGRVRERRRGERPSLSEGARGSSLMFTNECYPTAAAFRGVETLCVVGQVEAETAKEERDYWHGQMSAWRDSVEEARLQDSA